MAHVRESKFTQSDADFISKFGIDLKEGSETQYWLEVLMKAEYITEEPFLSLRADADHFVGLLVSILKNQETKSWTANPSQ